MSLPNLLIIGAQKCGTTWLHQVLKKSAHFWGSTPKELNFWNRANLDIEEYRQHFETSDKRATYYFESTPHYFRLPSRKVDTAERIRNHLGDIPLILLLRNPVERYLSAYTHHMMQGRVENVPVLEEISAKYRMIDLGYYFQILSHFETYFSRINIYLYDDIKSEPLKVVSTVFSDLELQCDLSNDALDFRTNDKRIKMQKLGIENIPKLSDRLKTELWATYRNDISALEHRLQRDLTHWAD